MHALQGLPAERFLPALLRKGLGSGDPLLEWEQFSAGRGQFGLQRDQGGSGSFLACSAFGNLDLKTEL